jgi:hypothetical protein
VIEAAILSPSEARSPKPEARARKRWLFSPAIDLSVFGGTALAALTLVWLWPHAGTDSPEWTWIAGILLVDVAHVWSTAFVVYLDPAEWKRRPLLYAGVPVACFVVAVALYACGEAVFWRAIAYLAVFHFIRQQYGWVMLYRARNGERDRLGRWLDGATIYACALYPLVYWHASLPRSFWWMVPGDFVAGLPFDIVYVAYAIYIGLLVSYAARVVAELARRRPTSWGKHVVVATTAALWYNGIVANNSDYAFTISNVFSHGIPYMVLVFFYARAASRESVSSGGVAAHMLGGRVLRALVIFLATLWFIAYFEEMIWDRALWHDRPWLFGGGVDVGGAAVIIGPLLAVPQLAHYVLDAFLWKRRSNPRLGRLL